MGASWPLGLRPSLTIQVPGSSASLPRGVIKCLGLRGKVPLFSQGREFWRLASPWLVSEDSCSQLLHLEPNGTIRQERAGAQGAVWPHCLSSKLLTREPPRQGAVQSRPGGEQMPGQGVQGRPHGRRQGEVPTVPCGHPAAMRWERGQDSSLGQAPRRKGLERRDAALLHHEVRAPPTVSCKAPYYAASRSLRPLPPAGPFLQLGSTAVLCHFNRGTGNTRDEDLSPLQGHDQDRQWEGQRGDPGHSLSRLASAHVQSRCLPWSLMFLSGSQLLPTARPPTAVAPLKPSAPATPPTQPPQPSLDACVLDLRSRARRRCPAQPQAWTRPWEDMAVPAASSPATVTQRQALAHL